MIIGILLSLAFWIVMAIFGGSLLEYQIIALFFFMGFSFGVADIFLTIPVNLCPTEISGLAIGSLNVFNFLGGGIFQFLTGLILDSTRQLGSAVFSYQIVFGVAAVCVVASLFSALKLNENVCG